MRPVRFLVVMVFAAAVAVPRAQDRTFRSTAELATIHFLASTGDGSPVTDLRRDELTLLIDGQHREIQQLQFIDRSSSVTSNIMPPVSRAPSTTLLSMTAPPGASERGRRIVIAANPEAIVRGTERLAVDAAAEFIKQLAPSDELTIVTLPMGRVLSTPDRPRAAALIALKEIVGYAAPGHPKANCGHVVAIDDFLRGLDRSSEPTTVVYISGTLPSAADCNLAFEQVRRSAEALPARFFVIEPNNFVIDVSQRQAPTPPSVAPEAGLGDLASVTGGELFRISGRATAAFERVAREMSGRFTLGFEPLAPERDGRPHKIRLATSRQGVTILVAPSISIRP